MRYQPGQIIGVGCYGDAVGAGHTATAEMARVALLQVQSVGGAQWGRHGGAITIMVVLQKYPEYDANDQRVIRDHKD